MKKTFEQIRWWHQVPLGDGRITPGMSKVYQVEDHYLFNEIDFKDKSVLDIGAWDGYFSFSAEKRGAKRVLALDNPDFRWGGTDGFDFLHDYFKSSVEWRKGSVYQLPEEMFDIVLCYGLLYHLSDPLLAMINCFQSANELVLFEGAMFENERPLMTLFEPPYLKDPTNVFNVSTGFMIMVGRLNGFKLLKHVQTAKERGSMMFQVEEKKPCPFKATVFPFWPSVGKLHQPPAKPTV